MSDIAITTLLKQYISDYKKIKRDNEEMGNIEFNKSFSLSVSPPKHWPFYEPLGDSVSHAFDLGFLNIVIVYSSTDTYNKIVKSIPIVEMSSKQVEYFSWHEIYSAMNRVQQDVSHMRRLKEVLGNADLVVFVGASTAMQVVVDQVLGSTSGCLILLG